jgi:RsiW-degrading membrane proteinase PrsW (M82 family)
MMAVSQSEAAARRLMTGWENLLGHMIISTRSRIFFNVAIIVLFLSDAMFSIKYYDQTKREGLSLVLDGFLIGSSTAFLLMMFRARQRK